MKQWHLREVPSVRFDQQRWGGRKYAVDVHRLLRPALILLGFVLVLGACRDASRPTGVEWQPTWDRAISLMPATPPDRDTCSKALGDLRALQGDLFPTPDLAVDDVVQTWVSIAEDALFECPPSNEAIPSFEFAIAELDKLEAEVAFILGIDSAGD